MNAKDDEGRRKGESVRGDAGEKGNEKEKEAREEKGRGLRRGDLPTAREEEARGT